MSMQGVSNGPKIGVLLKEVAAFWMCLAEVPLYITRNQIANVQCQHCNIPVDSILLHHFTPFPAYIEGNLCILT